MTASLTLNTKVYTFTRQDNSGIQWWTNKDGGISNSFSNASLSITDPTADKNGRIGAKLSMPIVATDDSVCGCAGTVLRVYGMTITVDIPGSGTTAEKTDFLARLRDYIGTTAFGNAVLAFTPAP